MAVFARDEAMRTPRHGQGLRCSSPQKSKQLDPAIPPAQVLSRDDILDHNIRSMQPQDDPKGLNGGVMRYIGDTEAKSARGRNANAKPDHDIFGPPVEDRKPRPRIRPGVSDAELQRIWHDDEKKAQAAQAMEKAPNLVDRMASEPPNPHVSSPKAKDAAGPARRPIDNLSDTTQQRNRQQFEPAGFAGMGSRCPATTGKGLACKPAEEFVAPEFKPRKLDGGQRTRATPRDTFSFQDQPAAVGTPRGL